MSDLFTLSLIFPVVCLAILGVSVPRVLAIWWPEGVSWLMILALASTFLVAACGAGVFAMAYAAQGINLDDLYATGGLSVPLHFIKLSLMSALLWAPLMVLSLIGVPKNWTKEVW